MPKIYSNEDVLTAAKKRLTIAFQEFDNIYFSFSGGKDSTVMLHLAKMIAEKTNKKFNVLFIDLEAQYSETIKHVEYMRTHLSDVVDEFYWVCLPLSLRNAVSVLQPKWTCWDTEVEDKWVRPYPKNAITEDICPFPFFYKNMEFEEFTLLFAEWFNKTHDDNISGAGIGIRSDESLNRFRTIVSKTKEPYQDYNWTTRVKINQKTINTYNFYPIYDWRTEDIWGAVSKYNWQYNQVYEWLYKNGVSIHQQRLCQPYGDDQRQSLDQFRELEPETWEKVLNRVEGVNFGNIYARTSLLGNIKSEKPPHMTWQQYSVFLLESLGLYAPELEIHYYNKIRKFLLWWEKEIGLKPEEIPDEKWEMEGRKRTPYWERIARAIERNDFWMNRLSFSQTKSDVKLLNEMCEKYNTNLIKAENTTDGKLKKFAQEIKK